MSDFKDAVTRLNDASRELLRLALLEALSNGSTYVAPEHIQMALARKGCG